MLVLFVRPLFLEFSWHLIWVQSLTCLFHHMSPTRFFTSTSECGTYQSFGAQHGIWSCCPLTFSSRGWSWTHVHYMWLTGAFTDSAFAAHQQILSLNIFTAVTKLGKVIFSQASVILLTGRVYVPGGCLLPGVACSRGCLLLGGVCSGEGVSALGRVCLLPAGVCPGGGAWWRPPLGMATAVGGTHPTGMHSCSNFD